MIQLFGVAGKQILKSQTRIELTVLTEYTSNPVISLYLSICSGGYRGEARRALWVKKKIAEERKVGRASKKKKMGPFLS